MSDAINSTNDSNKEANENKGGSNQPATNSGVISNAEQPVINPVPSECQSTKQHRDGYDKANLIILSLTLTAAVAAAIFTGLAWCTFEGQLDEMRKAYKPLEASAKAAKDSADILLGTQRAHVFVDTFNNEAHFGEHNEFLGINVSGVWKNFGLSPAKNVKVHAKRKIVNKEEIGNEISLDYDPTKDASDGFIGPNQTVVTDTIGITASELASAWDKKTTILIYLRADYIDALVSLPHHTEQCFEVVFRRDP